MLTKELLTKLESRNGLLVMIDLSHFSLLNAWLGHTHADKVLDGFQSILDKSVRMRERNFVFRWGGDEFIVFLEDMNYAHAHIYLNRLRAMSPLAFDATFISYYQMTSIDALETLDALLLKHKRERDASI